MICGTGSNDTRHSAELTHRAVEAGADAVLVVTPYYNKPNRAGLRAHFEAVAEAAGKTPVVLYNIPSRCVINRELSRFESRAAGKTARRLRQTSSTTSSFARPASSREALMTTW